MLIVTNTTITRERIKGAFLILKKIIEKWISIRELINCRCQLSFINRNLIMDTEINSEQKNQESIEISGQGELKDN